MASFPNLNVQQLKILTFLCLVFLGEHHNIGKKVDKTCEKTPIGIIRNLVILEVYYGNYILANNLETKSHTAAIRDKVKT